MKEIRFEQDILPLKDKLFRLAMRITLNREEAEDIVQDTLIRLWNLKDEWHKISNVETYALTICRNHALDSIEKRERRNVSLDETFHDRPDFSSQPDEQLIGRQQQERVEQIINHLPEKQRTALQLRDMEGKTYSEIAEAMQISVSDVKVNIFRARQTLRDRLLTRQ